MDSKRTILIWIGILTLVGIILLMVACETGVLTPLQSEENSSHEPIDQSNTVIVNEDSISTGGLEQASDNHVTPVEEPKTLTVGKPYSGKLVEEDSKNILIIGEDKVNNLYDTIGIASVDSKNKTVKLIMIPRDTYIEYNDDIKSVLDKEHLLHSPGVFKINFAHHVGNNIDYKGRFEPGSISFLAEVIEEKFNIELSDYVKINTKGFTELVDNLGGVDIQVPYNMDYEDPTQELYIHIPKGMQHLDGYNAEGFVRFRQGYKEDGSFFEVGDSGRKKNQLTFLRELIKQKGTIKNVGKIPDILEVLGKNVKHSIGLGDVLKTYMGVAADIVTDKYEITSENLNSEQMIRIDGSSYLVLE